MQGFARRRCDPPSLSLLIAETTERHMYQSPKDGSQVGLTAKSHCLSNNVKVPVSIDEQALCYLDAPLDQVAVKRQAG